jgi:FkbM family methyltransferase
MKFECGWWLPDDDRHMAEWMQRAQQTRDGMLQYQFHKYQWAINWVRSPLGLAVDIGAHIGFWSRNMALDFEQVVAFEPVPRHAECWRRNMESFKNAVLHECALGAASGTVSLSNSIEGASGDAAIITDASAVPVATDVQQVTLDSIALPRCDFMKIDCEGYEFFVIQGAERTIRQFKPCIIVEQKPGHARRFGLRRRAAVSLLTWWGMTVRKEIDGDYILSF